MMKPANLLLLAGIATLAACSSPEPQETAAAAEEPVAQQPADAPEAPQASTPEKPALPAPDDKVFKAAFAKACPRAARVNNATCLRAGMGSEKINCQYGLGKDEYLRHKAQLVPGEGEWVLADKAATCAQGKR